MKVWNKIILLITCLLLTISILPVHAQNTRQVGVDSVVVTFSAVPSQVNVQKAPLKYNKAFAMSFQEDDALSDIFNEVYPAFEGKDNNHGMFFSDGCGNLISFKMSSAIYIFAANLTDLLNPDDPWHDSGKLTWNDLKTLYHHGWGIENHGLFDNPNVSSAAIVDYAFKRTQSYAAKKISDSILFKTFVIPNNVVTYVDYLTKNQYHSALNQGQDNSWIGYGTDGFDVENDTINWLKKVKLNRLFIQTGFKSTADTLYAKSKQGIHKWFLSGMHTLPGSFLQELFQIYQTYGQPGLDNILIAPDDEILDYLAIKQATQVHNLLRNNKLTITFSGDIPTDRLFYALSLNITANQSITDIKVYGTSSYSSTGVGNDTALVNLSWQGRKYFSLSVMADSMTTLAVDNPSQYTGLVAMDYVQLLPEGQQKIALQQKLCGLDQSNWTLSYDNGFCNPVNLGNDTSLCAGSCIMLDGPVGMQSYEWKKLVNDSLLGTGSTLKVCPKETETISLNVTTTDGSIASDSILLTVLPSPVVSLGKDTSINIGDSLLLQAPKGTGYQYLWNTGDTGQSIICESNIPDTLVYSVYVKNQDNCQSEDTIKVFVHKVLNVPQVSTVFDTLTIAPGDVAHVVANSANANQFVWRYGTTVDTTTGGHLFFYPEQSVMVYVKACNDDGCSNEDSTFVKVVPISTDLLPSDTSLCAGSCLTLFGPKNMTIYKWESSNTDTIIGRRDSLVVCPQQNTLYFLTVVDKAGHVIKDSVALSVRTAPDIQIQYDTYRVCINSTVTLTASGGSHYLWSPSEDTNQSISFVISDTSKIYLRGANNEGCIGEDSVTLYALPRPDVSISGLLPAYCPNDPSVILSGSPEGGDFSGDGINGNVFFPFLAGPGLHTLYYTVSNTGECTASDSVSTFVYGPVPEINLHPADTVLLDGGMVTYDAGAGFNNYYWTTGDTTRIVHIFYSDFPNGTDTITVIGLAGACTSVGSAVIHFGETTGVTTPTNEGIHVFPNPNRGIFSINWPVSTEKLIFSISDITGHIIMQKKIDRGKSQLKLTLPGLKQGLYLVRFQSESGFWIKKVMVR